MFALAKNPILTRQTEKLFTEYWKRDLIDNRSGFPLSGDEIPGTGGVRKLPCGVRAGQAGRAQIVIAIWVAACRCTLFSPMRRMPGAT